MSRATRWLVVLLLVGMAIRSWMVISTPVAFDEYQWFRIIDAVSLRPSSFHVPIHGDEHPPGHVYWAAPGIWLFGRNLLGYRFASLVLGTGLIVVVFLLARELFDERAALLAAMLTATNEYLIGGVSRLCTEKSYLTFAALGLLLYLRTVRRPTTGGYAVTGLVLGLGTLTKQSLLLWIPLLLFDMLRRPDGRQQWRTKGPWVAVLLYLLAISPDVYWNLSATPQPESSNVGVGYQLEKLGLGWSWAPASLFLRPLFHRLVEPDVMEYPAMSMLPGGILLLGALVSLLWARSREARLLQALGWGPFAFFSFFGAYGTDAPAFWWSDLSVVPFIVLTGSAISLLAAKLDPPRRTVVWAAACIPFGVSSVQLMRSKDNYFPSSVWAPPRSVAQDAFQEQQFRFASYPDVDHAALSRFGPWCLPVSKVYARNFSVFIASGKALRVFRRTDTTGSQSGQARILDQLRRLEGCD